MFFVGNVLSAVVVFSEISGLVVCSDDNLGDDDYIPENTGVIVYVVFWFTLAFGLFVDVVSAVVLSMVYKSPLDMKSVHKIPVGDMRGCGGVAIVHFLTPFSWGVIYFCGGLISIMYGKNAPCEGNGGGCLETYLFISGALMALFGLVMLVLSPIMLLFACTSSFESCSKGCCARVRDIMHKGLLSKGRFFNCGWQLQGVVLMYRSGVFSFPLGIVLGVVEGFGEVLAAHGSFAPGPILGL